MEKKQKLSKAEAQYTNPAKGKDKCGMCKHFEVHGPNMCERVVGRIEPGAWCKEYEKSFRLTKIFEARGK